eukprot:g6368.t1
MQSSLSPLLSSPSFPSPPCPPPCSLSPPFSVDDEDDADRVAVFVAAAAECQDRCAGTCSLYDCTCPSYVADNMNVRSRVTRGLEKGWVLSFLLFNKASQPRSSTRLKTQTTNFVSREVEKISKRERKNVRLSTLNPKLSLRQPPDEQKPASILCLDLQAVSALRTWLAARKSRKTRVNSSVWMREKAELKTRVNSSVWMQEKGCRKTGTVLERLRLRYSDHCCMMI